MASQAFRRHLIHRGVVEERTDTQSTSGELIPTWAAGAGTVVCRFVEKTERIAAEGVGFMVLETHRLLCEADEDIDEEDRIVNITLAADGSTVDDGPFTIEEKVIRNTTRGHHMSLRLERVE